MNLKQKWINKRFRKKKIIDIEGEQVAQRHKPLVIEDGDESKTGGGPVEIDFNHVGRNTDIHFSVSPVEREEIDFEEGYAIYWFDTKELIDEGKLTLYYGCKNCWARLFDRFFIEEEKGYEDNTVMVQHLHSEANKQ